MDTMSKDYVEYQKWKRLEEELIELKEDLKLIKSRTTYDILLPHIIKRESLIGKYGSTQL